MWGGYANDYGRFPSGFDSFLPVINGKHLVLIENLSSGSNKLHPVQEAMVKFHGSQCGFCTPGFVMSMFAMYKNFSKFSDDIYFNRGINWSFYSI